MIAPMIAPMIASDGPFGPGLDRAPAEENRRRYFLSISALWNRNNVEGLRITASFATRRGLTNSVVNPSMNRSIVVRGGARRLVRRLIRCCCLSSRDSAMTERTPLGRTSYAREAIKCTARRSKSRIVSGAYHGHRSTQDCSCAASHAMICELAPHRFKSLRIAAVTLAGIELAHRISKGQLSFGRGRPLWRSRQIN